MLDRNAVLECKIYKCVGDKLYNALSYHNYNCSYNGTFFIIKKKAGVLECRVFHSFELRINGILNEYFYFKIN